MDDRRMGCRLDALRFFVSGHVCLKADGYFLHHLCHLLRAARVECCRLPARHAGGFGHPLRAFGGQGARAGTNGFKTSETEFRSGIGGLSRLRHSGWNGRIQIVRQRSNLHVTQRAAVGG